MKNKENVEKFQKWMLGFKKSRKAPLGKIVNKLIRWKDKFPVESFEKFKRFLFFHFTWNFFAVYIDPNFLHTFCVFSFWV